MKTDEIRTKFLEFFEGKGHTVVKSDSLIPENDPTLLFTGAGMNQFKDFFMGLRTDYLRATSSQKCLRTGDLENVGKTAYHHTFFEMLGNFSFGDYYKKEAICWAWEFLTTELKIPSDVLCVSVHSSDDESFSFWKNDVGVDESRIYRFGDKDNFWPSNAPTDGPNGPCGPCSEIFYDQGVDVGCQTAECSPACDCGRFAEIWNLVFTQYERLDGGELIALKAKNIDTGMGLERIACVLQGKRKNFEIDVFESLIAAIKDKAVKLVTDENISSVYAICDHLRSSVFCISDGAYPSNEGRGYVIRKLIRRSIWHAHLLGITTEFLADLVSIVIETYKKAYPELVENRSYITEVVASEEKRFLNTLEDGLDLLQSVIDETKASASTTISGDKVFKLYDTYGFPDELTRLIAEENNLEIDQKLFDKLMEEQRLKSKNSTQISDSIFTGSEFETRLAKLDASDFKGYELLEETAQLAFLFKGDCETEKISEGENAFVVLDKTPFYAESGGQVCDQGFIESESGLALVENVQKKMGVFYHEVKVEKGFLNLNQKVIASVDKERRERVMKNHTATHLLQAALRNILGEHVRQLGSLVSEDKLRFDFSYQKALSEEQKQKIEEMVNSWIKEDVALDVNITSVEEAKKSGALAFFGDRYGDEVRLVSIGNVSKELCGGTHASRTGVIEEIKIVNEGSVASGIRRIEAVTGQRAQQVRDALKLKEKQVADRKAEKEIEKKNRKELLNSLKSEDVILKIIDSKFAVGEVGLIVYQIDGLDQGALRGIYDSLKTRLNKTVIVLISGNDSKAGIVIGLTKDCESISISANDIAQKINKEFQGRGGGKQLLAFSGLPNSVDCEKIRRFIEGILK